MTCQDPNELLNSAVALYQEGMITDSARMLETCVEHCRAATDADSEMLAMSNLCEAYHRLGRLSDARIASSELLRVARKRGSVPYQIRAVGRLAMAVVPTASNEDLVSLRHQLEEAVADARSISLDYWVVQNLETLGALSMKMGDIYGAFDYYQTALVELKSDVNEHAFFRTRAYCGVARHMAAVGKFSSAHEYADLARVTAAHSGSSHLRTVAQICAAEVRLQAGEYNLAVDWAFGSASMARKSGWPLEERDSRCLLAKSYAALNLAPESYEEALLAIALNVELGLSADNGDLYFRAAQQSLGMGNARRARHELDRAAEIATENAQTELLQAINAFVSANVQNLQALQK